MTHSGKCIFTAEGVTLSGVRFGWGPNADRALETSIKLEAEGASVKHAKLSGKRTKTIKMLPL